MSKILLTFLATFFLLAGVKAQNSTVAGEWLLTKAVAKGKTQDIYSPFTFRNDGYVEMKGQAFGTWKYNAKTNIVSIESEMVKEFAGENKVVNLDDKKLTLKGPNMDLYFIKFDIEAANKKANFTGSWKVTEIKPIEEIESPGTDIDKYIDTKGNDDYFKNELEKLITFKLPGEFVSVENETGSVTTQRGDWFFLEDKNSVMISASDYEVRGLNQLLKVNDNELVLKNGENYIKAEKVKSKKIEVEKLTFTEDDFYDENGEFDFYALADKMPWRNAEEMIEKNENTSQLVYQYHKEIGETGNFKTKLLTANVRVSSDEYTLEMDYIFDGYDSENLPEGADEVKTVQYDPDNILFPFEDNPFRIAGTETITTEAGTFNCTVVEFAESFHNYKIWMINDKPAIVAKVIKQNTFSYDYSVFELKEIK